MKNMNINKNQLRHSLAYLIMYKLQSTSGILYTLDILELYCTSFNITKIKTVQIMQGIEVKALIDK